MEAEEQEEAQEEAEEEEEEAKVQLQDDQPYQETPRMAIIQITYKLQMVN